MEQQTWPRVLLCDETQDAARVYDALIEHWRNHRRGEHGFVPASPEVIAERMANGQPLERARIEWLVWSLGQTWFAMPGSGPRGGIEAPLLQIVSRRWDATGIIRWTYRPCRVVRLLLSREEEAA